ncbi:MAG TPA: hypothetical protein VNU24_00280 [Solirubrobacteraceae bacterium]|jgi:hypothetical protein|nr:hypothetical protein [Solirubrobacteraceae bacterium]
MSPSGSPDSPTGAGAPDPPRIGDSQEFDRRQGAPSVAGAGGMSRGPSGELDGGSPGGIAGTRYSLYIVILAAILLVAFTIHVALNSHKGATSIRPGTRIPPFAAPYAVGGPAGEVDVATHANDASAGRVPACSERGPRILNICELYERGPVVLALFFQAGSCPAILSDLQRLAPLFPQVGFAAVAVKEGSSSVAPLVRAKRLTVPVAVDGEGRLGELFAMVSCPQITFVYPGGVVQSASLLSTPPLSILRARVAGLLAASRARGWRPGRS